MVGAWSVDSVRGGEFVSSRRRVCSVSVELRVGSSHSRQWWECGELHRVDGGPAVEYTSGYCAWWERDRLIRREEV